MDHDLVSPNYVHASFGAHSAHEIASDGFDDYREGLSVLLGCAVGETVEDEYGEEWRRIA